ncbi:MAG: NAD-dependent epimerase/dehydratase family protein [Kiritimatiellae bacterium]|nr:NAD-dependent epimerase/dehydratase family protein [Kiritimatiellia bacterium]
MKILVTGSAGFIGFHVASALLKAGHTVVGLDNFNDYYTVQLKRDRHALLEKQKGYAGNAGDLCDYPALQALFRQHAFDRVCHLAAQPGVRYSITHPFVYHKCNSEGFLNVLEVCRHHKIARLVYASSSSVYGGNRRLPFRETDAVDTPVSLYAATKKSNELMAHVYSHLYGFQTIGLRLFTVYGPWYRPDMAMWLFTEAILHGKPVKVFNRGDQRRDFTYIDDIVSGICAALATDGLERYDIFNLGNHRAEHLMDMINILADALGIKPVMELLPMQPGDVMETYADISKAQQKLKFHPHTALADGIPKFVAWFRKYHGLT